MLPAPREPFAAPFREQNLHTIPAPALETRRLFPGAVCSPLPANPCGSVPGSKIFTQFPRRHSRPAGFSEARFAPRSLQTLAAPFREQNLHTISAPPPEAGRLFRGAERAPLPANPCGSVPGSKIFTQFPRRPRGRPAFPRRDLLPAPREPLRLRSGSKIFTQFPRRHSGPAGFSRRGLLPVPRKPLQLYSGEQNLHTIPAPPPEAGRLFRGAVCSPLPANPCGSVPGSKIFTQFPRRHSGPAGFFKARFAPRSPRTLVAPFREQNLHTISAPPPGAGRLFQGAVCSPLPANPCNSVPGSKFFTLFPRRPSKNPRSTFCFGDFSFTFIFLYLSISSRWDSGFRK